MIDYREEIEKLWENRETVGHCPIAQELLEQVLEGIDRGFYRVAEPDDQGGWHVNEWVKKTILLAFRIYQRGCIPGGPSESCWYDKVPSKFAQWSEEDFETAGFRAVPGAFVRRGAYIGPNCVLMPSFVNIGAYVDEGTMVDTWATIGSCAHIGKNCHISGGAGIGGVLEPLQAAPVIIEDNVFIGARSEVAEGVRVREGAVLGMGVYLGASTKIVRRETGEVLRGEVPPFSVVVPGNLPDPEGGAGLYCAVIVKEVDERTRAKTGINELLRT